MKPKYIFFMAALCSCLFSCDKDFLEKKPDKALLVPATISDVRAILDNHDMVINIAPALPVIAADNFHISDAGYLALRTELERFTYRWSNDPVQLNAVADWENGYKQVFYANVALDALKNIKKGREHDELTGSALFIRSLAYFNLVSAFAEPYVPGTAASVTGIPLYLEADVNARPGRGNLKQVYDQIIGDLNQAAGLLPASASVKTRPIKTAALALLARVYLSMEEYQKAGEFADAALKLNDKLIDFNTLNVAAARPLPAALPNGNDEVIFYTRLNSYSYFSSAATSVVPELYASYHPDDLRRSAYFNNRGNGVFNFKGSYSGSSDPFGGLATDEMYLIRAESFARQNDPNAAMNNLNALLVKRWKAGKFVTLTAASADDALRQILEERRKELLFRGLRWQDLRRLNRDARFAVTLTRTLNGNVLALPPGDKRFTFLIPQNEIAGSGVEQNDR